MLWCVGVSLTVRAVRVGLTGPSAKERGMAYIPIGWRIGALILGGAGLLAGVSAIAASSLVGYAATVRDVREIDQAALNFGVSDMMHDALNSDVLNARLLGGGSASERREIEQALAAHAHLFQEMLAANRAMSLPQDVGSKIAEVEGDLNAYIAAAQAAVETAFAGRLSPAEYESFDQAFSALEARNDAVRGALEAAADAMQASADAAQTRALWQILAAGVLALTLMSALGWWVHSTIRAGLGTLVQAQRRIAARETDVEIQGIDRPDALGAMAQSLEALRAITISAFRAEAAVTDSATPFLIADAEGVITSANRAFVSMAQARLADFREVQPDFHPDRVIGRTLSDLRRASTSEAGLVRLGGAVFHVTEWPVRGINAERLGQVEQWRDQTDEFAARLEIEAMSTRAAQGDFTMRIPIAGKSGFLEVLANNLNSQAEVVEGSLEEANRALGRLGEGDVTVRFEGVRMGQFKTLQDSVNRTAAAVGAIARDIAVAAGNVRASQSSIAAGATDLAARTEQQAASLEETAAAMEELAATLREVVGNAQNAAGRAEVASAGSELGAKVAVTTMSAMERIEERTSKISEIVGLIQSIAFQTNLLALNASVEAARAGDAGRGFAVVAGEVRALAGRTDSASRDIRQLIESANIEVRGGVDLVRQNAESQEAVRAAVNDVTTLIRQISASTHEQSQGFDEINRSVNQLDQITQMNAALASRTNQSLDEAAHHIEDLEARIAFFRENTPAYPRAGGKRFAAA